MISLMTVVHNEENRLYNFFHLVKDHVTEIVVVDDGSTDRTPFFAMQFANTCLRFKECSGYCEQRLNAALNLCTQNWVLRLDADERISRKHLVEICEKIGELDEFDSIQFNRKNYIDGKLVREEPKVRLVRRGVLYYLNKLHTEENGYTRTFLSSWEIIHDKTRTEVIDDFKRYKKEIEKNPDRDVEEMLRNRAEEYGVGTEL